MLGQQMPGRRLTLYLQLFPQYRLVYRIRLCLIIHLYTELVSGLFSIGLIIHAWQAFDLVVFAAHSATTSLSAVSGSASTYACTKSTVSLHNPLHCQLSCSVSATVFAGALLLSCVVVPAMNGTGLRCATNGHAATRAEALLADR